MAPQYKLSYFDVRALAEPIRLLFALQGVEYTDERIQRDNWPAIKDTKPWGNMPVLEEADGKVVSQSGAILRYLGKKYGLFGSTDFEAAKIDEMIEATTDLRTACFKVFMEADAEKKAEGQAKLKSETFPFYLKRWSAILEKNGTGYLVGNKLSVADLNVASYLQIFAESIPDLFKDYPAIQKHQAAVFNTKGIKEWIEKRPKSQW